MFMYFSVSAQCLCMLYVNGLSSHIFKFLYYKFLKYVFVGCNFEFFAF